MRAFLNLALLLALILLKATQADACDCAFGGAPVCQEYWKASAVFVGTVIDIKTVTTREGSDDWPRRLVRFSLDEPFRGVEGAEVEVLTGMGGGDCGIAFKQVQTYLVFATLFEGKLHTGICMRTKPLADAAADLEYMRGLKNAKPGGIIYGEVTTYKPNQKEEARRRSQPGATIVVEGPTQREISTDAKGAYRLENLPAGDYTVKISPPEGTSTRQPEQKISVANGGCAVVSFWLENNGQLSGRVVNPEGLPVNKAEVVLGEFDKEHYQGHSDYAYSDQEGRYAFKLIPPGRYVLMIRFDGMTSQNRPFPRIYYPGVTERTQAKVITIGEGQTIDGFNLQLPPLPLEYEIIGSVVWADGKPALGARVGYSMVGDSVSYSVKSGEVASFNLTAYEGLRLTMRAELERQNGRTVYSDWVQITVTPGMPSVKLVLPQP